MNNGRKVSDLEHRLLKEELGKDAAHRPHVNGRRVNLGAKEEFRRTIPNSGIIINY